jgi:formylmethanofuran dehydrogenase subunit E
MDNYERFLIHEAEADEALDNFPKCDFCGEVIQEDHLYDIGDEIYCEECMEAHFKKPTERYMKG